MVGGTRIIAFDSAGPDAPGDEILLTDEVGEPAAAAPEWPAEEQAPPLPRREWLLPALALTAIAAWTGFFGWAMRGAAYGLDPAAAARLIGDWAIPVLLVGVVWLIFLRSSRREATRFGNIARVLSDESARLELRLTTVNRELSLAREFIAAQARDLDALGRMATERLSQNADRLQSLILDNGSRIDSIGSVSEAALDNMEKLRGQLPVIASSAKDVTNNIGNAGRTAGAQLAEMISGFERLNQFGEASERQVRGLRHQVDDALGEFTRQCEQLEQIVTTRFAVLSERGAEFRSQLDTHETDTLAAIRNRAAVLAGEVAETCQHLDVQEAESLTSLRARLSALRDEGGAIARSIRDGESRSLDSWREAVGRIDSELQNAIAGIEAAENRAVDSARAHLDAVRQEAADLEAQLAERSRAFAADLLQRRAGIDADDQASIARLADHLAALDTDVGRRRTLHEQHAAALAAVGDGMTAKLAEFEAYLTAIAARGSEAEANLSASVETLAGRLGESRNVLAGTDREIAALTDSGVRLLEILQASKQQSRDELQDALAAGEKRLAAFEGRVNALHHAVVEASQHGETLSGLIVNSERDLRASFQGIEELQASLGQSNAAHRETLGELRDALADVEERSTRLADKARGELSEALGTLLQSANAAVAAIGENGAQAVTVLAGQLGEQSGAAIEKAMRASAAEAAGQLEIAAAHAAGMSREAMVQLRDQLAKVNELVGNLERRVAQARQRAEEQVDNDFSRRAALITESLNSNAIDIAKALSSDVSDMAWSAYLRGDRGIFTRRAVSLLDNGEVKSIAQIYEGDQDFREHVSRYIHDFEAILRQVLSTRDGHALGVTLLSSDMGKLYVAMAQAIERFRN